MFLDIFIFFVCKVWLSSHMYIKILSKKWCITFCLYFNPFFRIINYIITTTNTTKIFVFIFIKKICLDYYKINYVNAGTIFTIHGNLDIIFINIVMDFVIKSHKFKN
jgi:hypothetical protein